MIVKSPFDPSASFEMPEPGTMPRSQFDQLLKKKVQELNMSMAPTPQPVESPGMRLGQAMRQAFTPSQAPIDAGIKAGLMPEQVTAVNQQLLAERQLEQQNAIAQEEMGIKREYADVQRQQAAMGLEEQRMRLAAMFMPKPVEYTVDIDSQSGQMVRKGSDGTAEVLPTKLERAPEYRDLGGSLGVLDSMGNIVREIPKSMSPEGRAADADRDASRAIMAARAARAGGGGGLAGTGIQVIEGVPYTKVRDPAAPGGWRLIPTEGFTPPPPEAPEAPAPQDIAAAVSLANETRMRPVLENIITRTPEGAAALNGLAGEFGSPKAIPAERLLALATQLDPTATAKEEAIRNEAATAVLSGKLPFNASDELVQLPTGGFVPKADVEIIPDQPPVPAPLPFPFLGAPAPAQAPPPKPKQLTMSELLGLRKPVSVNAPVNPYQRMFE